jgi:hypothetical protein
MMSDTSPSPQQDEQDVFTDDLQTDDVEMTPAPAHNESPGEYAESSAPPSQESWAAAPDHISEVTISSTTEELPTSATRAPEDEDEPILPLLSSPTPTQPANDLESSSGETSSPGAGQAHDHDVFATPKAPSAIDLSPSPTTHAVDLSPPTAASTGAAGSAMFAPWNQYSVSAEGRARRLLEVAEEVAALPDPFPDDETLPGPEAGSGSQADPAAAIDLDRIAAVNQRMDNDPMWHGFFSDHASDSDNGGEGADDAE